MGEHLKGSSILSPVLEGRISPPRPHTINDIVSWEDNRGDMPTAPITVTNTKG